MVRSIRWNRGKQQGASLVTAAPRPSTPSELQYSDRRLLSLRPGRELSINPEIVAKWRIRQTVEDRKTGAKEPRSTILSEAADRPCDTNTSTCRNFATISSGLCFFWGIPLSSIWLESLL